MNTSLLEQEITKYEGFITECQTEISSLKVKEKEDNAILKQMKKSLERLRDADPEQKKG